MAKLSPPIYVQSPGSDDEVITFGKSGAERQSDLENGVARFGGDWRQPSYSKAYLRAARVLVATANASGDLDQLGLPIFYLLRHATELLVKGELDMLYEIARMRHELRPTVVNFANLPSGKAQQRLVKSHDLMPLCDDLMKISEALGFGRYVDKRLAQLAADLTAFESSATWARYARPQQPSHETHTAHEVAVPLVSLQQRLERVVSSMSVDFNNQDVKTFEGETYFEWACLMHETDAGQR